MGKNKFKKSEEQREEIDINNDFAQYIREIAQNIDNDDETRISIINNFINEIPENKESIIPLDRNGSEILDKLIGFSSSDNFEKYTSCLRDLRKLISNINASYVLEKCVKIATIRALASSKVKKEEKDNNDEDDEPESKKKKYTKKSSDIEYNLQLDIKPKHIQYCNEFILRLSKFALNNLEDLLTTQGNHFIRTCVLCLSGIVAYKLHDKGPINQINLLKEHGKSIDQEWMDVILDFATRLQQWPQFSQLAFQEKSSAFLQVLCQALSNTGQEKSLKKLIKAIVKNCFCEDNEGNATVPFTSKPSLFLLESLLQYSDEKQFTKLYEKYFKSKLTEMAQNEHNFTIQRLLDSVKSKEIFEEIFNELSKIIATLLQNGKTGVVLALSKACERLSFKQGQFIQLIIKSLECEKAQNLVIPCIVTLMPANIIEKDLNNIDVHLHGSLILQNLLNYNKPIKIVQSILDMKPQILSDIFCHQKGSRIADTFLESKFIGEKSREKLIKHLEGMYLKMAINRNGSHVLEKIYQSSLESQKEIIVKELAERFNQLNGCGCGRIISFKFNVEAYNKNPNLWKNYLARSSK